MKQKYLVKHLFIQEKDWKEFKKMKKSKKKKKKKKKEKKKKRRRCNTNFGSITYASKEKIRNG